MCLTQVLLLKVNCEVRKKRDRQTDREPDRQAGRQAERERCPMEMYLKYLHHLI